MTTIKSTTATVNFVEFVGDTLDMNFLYKSKNSSTPHDLTNFAAKLIIYDINKLEVLTLTSSLNADQVRLTNTSPNILITVSKTNTTTLGLGNFTYSVVLTDTLAKDNTLIVGDLILQDRNAEASQLNQTYDVWGDLTQSSNSTNTITSSNSITPNTQYSQYSITALATNTTVNNSIGMAVNGQSLILYFKDNGTSRTITWASGQYGYRGIGVVLPTTTTANKRMYVSMIYNATDSMWDVINIAKET